MNTMAILDLQGLDTNAAELTMTGSTVSNNC
ncbi:MULTISPECIES: SapB/AmfS family lanthipeptide [Crossiella]|nr:MULTISPECIES: SapB/AmfS family lanthipeptide [Crossiella]MCK2241367.1 SapB/AmfS family lanthipeptide [Crossiella sp. S99.2]MCK2253489.1 SapB/AmfS family lanthipeptide [Crossiella sp. S99.1]